MKEQFQHTLLSSFSLWFDNYLLRKGEAYTNQTGSFFNYQDSRVPSGYNVFGSSYKQFVTDSSITGANIADGIYVDGVWRDRSNDVIIDYENGRVLSTGISPSSEVTGSFAYKDFNIYFTNETEEDLIIERQHKFSKKFPVEEKAIEPYDQTIPAIFINTETFKNEPFAFGGLDKTYSKVSCVVMADNTYHLDGVLSIFADSRNEVFAKIPFAEHPINEWGDIKLPPFNYSSLQSNYRDSLFFIENIIATKISDRIRENLPKNTYIGFLDFDIYTHREPRH